MLEPRDLVSENRELKRQLREAGLLIEKYELMLGMRQVLKRSVDQRRREMVMLAAEELKGQGAILKPIPDSEYFGLEGLNQSGLVKSGLIRGSIAWLSRHAKAGNFSPHRIGNELWYDALDIKEVQEFERQPTIVGKVRPIGYTRRRRIIQT